MKEETLVNLDIEDDMTCDVIGDVHGMMPSLLVDLRSYLYHRSILRHAPFVLLNRSAIRQALSVDEW